MPESSPVASEDASVPRSLDQDEAYVRIERQLRLIRRYWYGIATGPFLLVITLLFRYSRDSSSWIWDVTVAVSLVWAMMVAIYGFVLTALTLTIRCPRCKWRFGWGDLCGSCGLPRHFDVYREAR